jgi:hypothetical protein
MCPWLFGLSILCLRHRAASPTPHKGLLNCLPSVTLKNIILLTVMPFPQNPDLALYQGSLSAVHLYGETMDLINCTSAGVCGLRGGGVGEQVQ